MVWHFYQICNISLLSFHYWLARWIHRLHPGTQTQILTAPSQKMSRHFACHFEQNTWKWNIANLKKVSWSWGPLESGTFFRFAIFLSALNRLSKWIDMFRPDTHSQIATGPGQISSSLPLSSLHYLSMAHSFPCPGGIKSRIQIGLRCSCGI